MNDISRLLFNLPVALSFTSKVESAVLSPTIILIGIPIKSESANFHQLVFLDRHRNLVLFLLIYYKHHLLVSGPLICVGVASVP